jgi:parallel beta helix pectate lyase-like protein
MRQRTTVFAFCLLMAIGAASQYAQAANLSVNCDNHESIHKALRLLALSNPQGPNTVSVSGRCRENILIQSMDRLTLIAKKNASITDRSGGISEVVDIEDSRSVTVQGFSINGGSGGVSCGTASVCYLTGNTIQAAVAEGVSVLAGSNAFLESNVIQNNGGRGSVADRAARMFSSNDIFQDNAEEGVAVFVSYFEASNSSILKNAGGIKAGTATLRLLGSTISGNGGDGTTLLAGTSAVFLFSTITGNGGNGVYLNDGSLAAFLDTGVTGNLSGLDVDCEPQFPIAGGVETTGGITNCVETASKSKPNAEK